MKECGTLKKCAHGLMRAQGRHTLAKERVGTVDAWEVTRKALVDQIDNAIARLHAHYDQLEMPKTISTRGKTVVTQHGEVFSIRSKQ